MHFFGSDQVHHLLISFGYAAVGGLVAAESMGLPVPGETALIAAALLAGSTRSLDIYFIVAAAAAGAIVGDNIGFALGRKLGFWLLIHYGRYVGITAPRIK